jgi:hypothetical protein
MLIFFDMMQQTGQVDCSRLRSVFCLQELEYTTQADLAPPSTPQIIPNTQQSLSAQIIGGIAAAGGVVFLLMAVTAGFFCCKRSKVQAGTGGLHAEIGYGQAVRYSNKSSDQNQISPIN